MPREARIGASPGNSPCLAAGHPDIFNNPNGAPLTPQGGIVADGHYVLKNVYVVTADPQPDLAADLWIQDGRYELQTETREGATASYGGELATSGTSLLLTLDCGGQASAPDWQYSAGPNNLQVAFTKDGVAWLYVFFRRPD